MCYGGLKMKAKRLRTGIVKGMLQVDMRSIWYPKFSRLAARKLRRTGRGPAGPSELAVRRQANQVARQVADQVAAKRDAMNARRRLSRSKLAALKRIVSQKSSDQETTE